MTKVFLDTSYAIALASVTDTHHRRAVRLADQLDPRCVLMVTTRPVLFEIGNALARRRHRAAATALLESLEDDEQVEIVGAAAVYARAFELFKNRPDKDWGLTDCYSFIVMTELGIRQALTADDHFEQAGFRALLRHDDVLRLDRVD